MIYLGADHRGFKLKEFLKSYLVQVGHRVLDMGNYHYDKDDDYPDFAVPVARKVNEDPENARGILLCGSGVGIDVAANRFKNVRSVLASSAEQARSSRNDVDTNILCLGADFLNEEEARKIVEVWLATPFSGEERHKRRIAKIESFFPPQPTP